MMKSQKNIIVRSTLMVALLLSFSLNSCKKSEEAVIPGGPVRLIVNMLGVEDADEPLAVANGGASAKLASVGQTMGHTVYSEAIQETKVPFDNKRSIVATLVPQSLSATSGTSGSLNRLSATRPEAIAVTGPVQNVLRAGMKWNLYVYNSAGTFVTLRKYVSGSEEATAAITELTTGEEYTFIAYALDKSSLFFPLVAVISQNNLSTAYIYVTPTSEPFMVFKTVMRLKDGDNFLDIVLKNLYSKITTNITLDNSSMTGMITAISGVAITPTRATTTYELGNELLSYSSTSQPGGRIVVFPSLGTGVRTISSSATTIATPATSNGILTIGSITINGVTRKNLSIPNLNITPGVRYNLNLTFQGL